MLLLLLALTLCQGPVVDCQDDALVFISDTTGDWWYGEAGAEWRTVSQHEIRRVVLRVPTYGCTATAAMPVWYDHTYGVYHTPSQGDGVWYYFDGYYYNFIHMEFDTPKGAHQMRVTWGGLTKWVTVHVN